VDGLIKSGAQGLAFAPQIGVAADARSATPIVLAVILLFGCSGGLLWFAGYNYNGLSGNPLTKIHPGTYLILATFLWNAVTSGNPVAYAARGAWRQPGSLLLFMAMVALFTQTVSRAAPGMAGSIDTFLGPTLLVVLMVDLDERGMRRIEITLHTLMTLNAVVALVEFAAGVRFFPFRYDGAVDMYDPRATALQGHPLENAAVTAFYVLALLNSNALLRTAYKVILIGLQFAALVAFGGRTGMVVALVLGGIYLTTRAHHALRTGRIPILTAAAVMILAPLVPAVIVALAAGGFFDALMTRFVVDDGGSAASRLEMFRIFADVPFRDLLFGPDPNLITSQRWLHGLEAGIENPIVTMLLYQGVLITVFMTVAVTAFLYEVTRLCAGGVWLPMLTFVILLNSSESIASKTNIVTKFVLVVLCLYRPRVDLLNLGQATGRARR
jgi:hypothetical protein